MDRVRVVVREVEMAPASADLGERLMDSLLGGGVGEPDGEEEQWQAMKGRKVHISPHKTKSSYDVDLSSSSILMMT